MAPSGLIGPNRLVFIGLGLTDSSREAAGFRRLAQLSGGTFVPVSDASGLAKVLITQVRPSSGGWGPVPGTAPALGPVLWGSAIVLVNLALVVSIVMLRRKR